jgi:DNA modification methylase
MQNILNVSNIERDEVNLQKLDKLLSSDLDFHDQASNYASHNFHAFAAKFPPQLPAKFITALTRKGDTVLDPMLGSGTTILEAYLSDRFGIGFDIDPLALKISKVKVTPIDIIEAQKIGGNILKKAIDSIDNHHMDLEDILNSNWDSATKEFIDYWFEHDTQIEIMAILKEIQKITDENYRRLFELTLSGIIITKSGGVSLALDLAHTRPHRAKTIIHKVDSIKPDNLNYSNEATQNFHSTKYLRSALGEFSKKLQQNLNSIPEHLSESIIPCISLGNAKDLNLDSNSVDLVVTSPPYPSNAIDYMRAHKFSLVWFGYSIDDLSHTRHGYIGSDSLKGANFDHLPDYTTGVVFKVMQKDRSKGLSLNHYYSEMTQSLSEIHRVLKPGKSAIVVVGSSMVRGIDTKTAECLAEISKSLGFAVPRIGLRKLDRDRRMMPVQRHNPDLNSQIQQRMHEEYVIGCYKPL